MYVLKYVRVTISFYAIKINGDGELIWEKKIERNASIYAYDMIETKNHNYLFTGKYAHDVNNSDIFLYGPNIQNNSLTQITDLLINSFFA